MTRRRYVQLDVFASRAGDGNPLAVVLDAEGLDDARMQAIARWTRLPETTFVLPPVATDATHRIRIFSPRREVPFAGHPSVGTAHALLDAGLAAPRDGLLVQDGIAGKLPLREAGARALEDLERLERAVGQAVPVARAARLVDDAELASEADLRNAQPNWEAIVALAHATDSMGLFVYARSQDPVHYFAVRAFVGAPARFEDAASGAANATLAAWLAECGALPDGGFYRVSQGREVGHDAIIELRVDAGGDVWSGGRAVAVVTGTLDWPD